MESKILIGWSKDSNVQLEYDGKTYELFIVYPQEHRYQTVITTRKTEILRELKTLSKTIKVPEWH